MRVIITAEIEEWWGADDALKFGGEPYVIEMLQEDIPALLEKAVWKLELAHPTKARD